MTTEQTRDALAQLEAVMALSDEATPGKWSVYNGNEGMPREYRPHWCFANDEYHNPSEEDAPSVHASFDCGCESDARLVVGLVNWLRDHAKTLRALLGAATKCPGCPAGKFEGHDCSAPDCGALLGAADGVEITDAMVEKGARAICAYWKHDPDEPVRYAGRNGKIVRDPDGNKLPQWTMHRIDSRAVLEATLAKAPAND